MFDFGRLQDQRDANDWRSRLDRFADRHRQELAALAWGLALETREPPETLGIDVKPTPHFIACPRPQIEALNANTGGLLQEILGLIDGHDREREVLILTVGEGQVKLLNFQPDPSPPACFEAIGKDPETLMSELEQHLAREWERQ